MRIEIFRNFPHPFRRRRTRLNYLKFGAFAVVVIASVCAGQITVSEYSEYDGGGRVPAAVPQAIDTGPQLTSSTQSSSTGISSISTNFAAVKNNTFRTTGKSKKFANYFLSKKLTNSALFTGPSNNATDEATAPTSTAVPTTVSTSGTEKSFSSAATPKIAKSATSKPTTIKAEQSTSSTMPPHEFITPMLPTLETLESDFSVAGLLSQNASLPEEADHSMLFNNNFYEVLPVPSGFGSDLEGHLQDITSVDNLQAEQTIPEMALTMHADPDNLAFAHHEVNDLEVPDQIAMGTDFAFKKVVAPPGSPPTADSRIGVAGFHRQTGAGGSNLPQSFEKFGVKDSVYYKNALPSPAVAAANIQNSLRNSKRFPAGISGFSGTPPPQSQQPISFQNSNGFNSHGARKQSHVTTRPNAKQVFQFSRGGLHEISPFTGAPVRPTPASHNLRLNPNPNIQGFAPYSPTVRSQHSHGGPHHIQSVSTVRTQGAKSINTPYHGQQVGVPTTIRPVIHTPSSPVSFGNTWKPTLTAGPVYHGRTRLAGGRSDNMVASGSQVHTKIAHPHTFSHRPTPPPGRFQPSESYLGSFETGPEGFPKVGNGPFHSASGFRPVGPPPGHSLKMASGTSFFDFESGSAAFSGPDGGQSHSPHQQSHHSHHPLGPKPTRRSHIPAQQKPFGVPILSIPQSHFPGPPPKNLNLGPPPLNEFNIQPVPQHRPSQQNTPHHYNTPNSHSSHFTTSSLGSPPAGVEHSSGALPTFGDFGGFQGSNIPRPAGHLDSSSSSYTNYPGTTHPQSFEAQGFQGSPAHHENTLNADLPDSPWIPKPQGHSHRHRYKPHAPHIPLSLQQSPSHKSEPGLAGLPGGNRPLLPPHTQASEYPEIDKHDSNREEGAAQSQDSLEYGTPPAGFYELPSPPNAPHLQTESATNSASAEESPAKTENDQSQNNSEGNNSAATDDGATAQQPEDADPNNYNNQASSDEQHDQGQTSNEQQQQQSSFPAQETPNFGGPGEGAISHSSSYTDFGSFSIEPQEAVLPQHRPGRIRGGKKRRPMQGLTRFPQTENAQEEKPKSHHSQQQTYGKNGFQNFGNFPGHNADLVLQDSPNENNQQSSNELGDGAFQPGVNDQQIDQVEYHPPQHFQAGAPPTSHSYGNTDTSAESSASAEHAPPLAGPPGGYQGQTYSYKQRHPQHVVPAAPEHSPHQNNIINESPAGIGPGPDFNGGLSGFGIGPNSGGRPTLGPTGGAMAHAPVGPVGPALAPVRGSRLPTGPAAAPQARPSGPAQIGGGVGTGKLKTGIRGQAQPQGQGHKESSPDSHHKSPPNPLQNIPVLLNGLGGLLESAPVRGMNLLKGMLDTNNLRGVLDTNALRGVLDTNALRGVLEGSSNIRGVLDGGNDNFKFNFPGKNDFNFGKGASSFDFERDKNRIMATQQNFGNEGFSFGKNTFSFGKDAQKFGKDPFGRNPYSDIGTGQIGFPIGKIPLPIPNAVALAQNVKLPQGVGDLYDTGLSLSNKIQDFYAKLAIPKDHYLRVLGFAGIYLFMAYLLRENEHLLYPKCENWGWNPPEHFTFHAPAYFVPATPVDQHMQAEFFDLFRGLDHRLQKKKKKKKKKDKKKKKKHHHMGGHKKGNKKKDNDNDNDGSSSEEDEEDDEEAEDDEVSYEVEYNHDLSFINDMCPRDRFFYSMSPYHLEATQALAQMFVEQNSPADLLHLARSILLSHKVNPKVWYIAMVQAALQRPDMTGFQLAHPIDAIPDLFIPGHLIADDFDRYRGGPSRVKRSATSFLASLKNSLNGTMFSGTVKDRYNRFMSRRGIFNVTTRGTRGTTPPPLKVTPSPTTTRTPKTTTMAVETTTTMATSFGNDTAESLIEQLLRQRKEEDSDEESDEVDVDDDEADDKSDVKKHPLGHGFGQIGDGYGKYKSRQGGVVQIGNLLAGGERQGALGNGGGAGPAGALGGLIGGGGLLGGGSNNGIGSLLGGGNSNGVGSLLGGGSNSGGGGGNGIGSLLGGGNGNGESGGNGLGSLLGGGNNNNGGGGNGLGNLLGGGNNNGAQGNRPGGAGNRFPGQGQGQGQGQGRPFNRPNRNKKKDKKKKKKKKKCIIVDGSVGLDNGIENKLWYWREDMMMNQHHWYWHQAYPVNGSRALDRRAELFFYMHRSMIARYNAERLSNGFARVHELPILPGSLIQEGYDSHLVDFNSGHRWTPRAPLTPISDVMHIHDPDFARDVVVNDVVDLYNRIVRAIRLGLLLTSDGRLLPIRFHAGIEPLANTVEASNASVNPLYYDAAGFHNLGHIMIGLSADPDYSQKLPAAVMADTGTAMRDPSFYTFHTLIDNLFDKFKKTLPPYKPYGGVWPLQWHGVDMVDVTLQTHGIGDHNQLATFFIKHKFQLEPGVDRSIEKGIEKANVCAVHLDHAPFQFQITIDRKKCAKSKSGMGTIRIFMAPRFDEHGDRIPLLEQRRLMFQLDAFQAELKVGRNVITRNSRDNSLTRPWTRSLRDYEKGPDPSGAADYCGCGWPHHLYLPKGNPKGMAFDLFVMVTNFDEDFVADHPMDLEQPESCNSPYIFCGRPRRRYPDGRPMGYPFDRLPYQVPANSCFGYGHSMKELLCQLTGKFFTRPASTLEEFVSGATNMAMIVFEVKHIPKVIGKHIG